MNTLAYAGPNHANALHLRQRVNAGLQESLIYLADEYASAGYDAAHLRAQVGNLDTGQKLSGLAHVLHDRLVSAAMSDGEIDANEVIESAGMLDFTAGDEPQIFAWNVDGPDFRWHQYLYDACDQSFLKTYNAHFDGAHPTLSEYSAAAEAISQSLEALQEIDPDAFDEVTNYISHIILFHSPTMNAATSMTCLGIIRLSQLREGQIWSRYLENIVHETGHHHLNFLLQEDLILLNEGDASFKSPLRRESRPLSGILHALFVLGRTIRLTRKFERSRFYRRGDRIGSSYNNAKNPGSFDEKFEDCWNILTTRADFTPLGQQLVQSIRETAYE